MVVALGSGFPGASPAAERVPLPNHTLRRFYFPVFSQMLVSFHSYRITFYPPMFIGYTGVFMAKEWAKKWTYTPAYDLVGLNKVAKRIGFQASTTVALKSNFDEWLAKIQQADYKALDTETMDVSTGKPTLKFDEATAVMIVISTPGNNNLVCFWYPDLVKKETQPLLATRDQIKQLVKACLNGKAPTFFWNRLFDQHVLLNPINNADNWLCPEDFFMSIDALGLLWSMDTNVKFGLGLKPFASDYLGLEMSSFEDNVTENWLATDLKQATVYAAKDGYATLEAGQLLYRLSKERTPFFAEVDREFQNTLYYLECQTVRTSVEPLKELEKSVAGLLGKVTSRFYESYGNINLGSTKQKADLLTSLGYSTGEFTATGAMSTAKAPLQKLATAGCEPAKFMLDFSKYKTLLNNFITKMVVHLEKDLPVRFKLYGYRVPTARLAAGSYKVSKKKDGVYDWFAPMNLQAVAKPKHVMRELNYDLKTKQIQFLPDDQTGEYYVEAGTSDLNARCWIGGHEGRIIVETDYSQLELLIPINLSKEPVWMEAKRQGQDLHKVTAAMIWNKPYADVTYDERQIAKRCFSINTFIATRDGWVRSKDLNGRAILDLKLKDQGYKAVIEKRQGFRVTLSNGQQIECVDDHNWVCFNRHKLVKVPASKLKIGDYLGVRQDSVFATDYLRFEIGDGYKSHAFHGEVVLDEALGYLLGLNHLDAPQTHNDKHLI